MGETSEPLPEGFSAITEGKATVLQQGNSVFYNKAQVVNRDISIAMLRWYIKTTAEERAGSKRKRKPTKLPADTVFKRGVKGISILEGLAATGLRAIRYAREVEGIGQVVANDLDTEAVNSMRRNIAYNKVEGTVTPSLSDARLVMMQHAEVFDVVDIDPYGSPTELLDCAVQAVADGGLLMVTATDMAVLCGNTAETCFTKYGSYSLHKDYNHEQGLRILLACITQHAARHKRYIEPVLCLSIDFYIRVFVRVRTSAAEVKKTASKLSYIWQSTGCDSWWLQPLGLETLKNGHTKFQVGRGPVVPTECPISTGRFHMGGPIWNGPLHDQAAVAHLLKHIGESKELYPAHAKICGLLRAVREELPDVPLYYTLASMSRTLKVTSPKMAMVHNAIVNAGFRASATHCNPGGIKTDAPPEVIWDIMRCWVKKNEVKVKEPESYQAKILATEPKLQADFSKPAGGAFSQAKAKNQARFVQNPENWGPRPKHGRPLLKHELAEAGTVAAAAGPSAGAKKQKADAIAADGEPAAAKKQKTEVESDEPEVKTGTPEVMAKV